MQEKWQRTPFEVTQTGQTSHFKLQVKKTEQYNVSSKVQFLSNCSTYKTFKLPNDKEHRFWGLHAIELMVK